MSINIGKLSVSPGSRGFVQIPIAKLASGYELKIPVHIINGVEGGPRLLINNLSHGIEWPTIEPLRRFLSEIDEKQLSGTVIAVSVANPLTYESQTRYSLQDGLDLNRVFPGEAYIADPKEDYGGITPKIAYALFEEVISKVDYIIDLHCAPWGSMFNWTNVVVLKGGEVEETIKLAQVFGTEVIRRPSAPVEMVRYQGTLASMAVEKYNTPGVLTSLGGGGFGPSIDELFIEKNVRGLRNIARYLGMLEGEIVEPEKQIITDCYAQRPNHCGLHIPEVGIDRLLDFVKEGEILGRTISPYTYEELEVMKAPCDGILCAIRALSPVTFDIVGVPFYYIAATESGTWLIK